jgi:hypothetical protein
MSLSLNNNRTIRTLLTGGNIVLIGALRNLYSRIKEAKAFTKNIYIFVF